MSSEQKRLPVPRDSKHYVNFFEGGFAARFISGVTPFAGVYSDEVGNCKILILTGNQPDGSPCFSSMHLNATVPKGVIEREQSWVGEPQQIWIMEHYQKILLQQKILKVNQLESRKLKASRIYLMIQISK